MKRSAWSVVAFMLVMSLKSASATDPYPLDALSEITSGWAEAAGGVNRLHAGIRRFEYDSVYRTVREWEGTLDFERPNRCWLKLRPVAAKQRKPVTIGDVQFEPFEGEAFTWIWTDEEWIYWNHDADICEAIPLATSSQSFWWNPPSPQLMLLFVTSDPESLAKLGYKLVEQRFGMQAGLTALPESQVAKRQVHRIDILFDPDTGLPRASRAINPQETMTTVLIVSNVQLNPVNDRKNLFEPPVKKMTCFTANVASPPVNESEEVVAGDRPIYESTAFWALLVELLGTTRDQPAPAPVAP